MNLSNTATKRKQLYKAVISVTNVDCDKTLTGKILLGLDSGNGIPNLVEIPTGYPIILDVDKDLQRINATFYHVDDEKEICSGTLIVPADVAYNVEINTTGRIYKRIYGVHALNDMLGVDFKMTFINTILFQEQGDPLPQTIGPQTRGDTTPLHLRISPSHPRKNKVFKYDEAMLHDYTCRIIDRKLG